MPIKILVISDYNAYHTVRPEAELFIGLAKKGFDVNIMTYGDSEYAKIFREHGIHVIDYHPNKKFSRKATQIIRNELKKGKYDVLHMFNSRASIVGIRAAKGIPVKIALYRGFTGHIHWYDPSILLKYFHPRVDRIVCNSIGVKQLFDRQPFFNKTKAVAINKGHRTSWYSNVESKNVRAELGIPNDALLLVNVSRNHPMKGIPYLMKAMSELPVDANVHLLMIGKELDTPENLKLLSEEAKKKVHFMGYRKDALSIVATSDAFVLSSLYGESITKAVIEAMSLSVAPLITDIPGNIELVENGVNGLVVPKENPKAMADAILKLEADRNMCKEYGLKAKEHIDTKLGIDRTIELYTKLYEDMVGRGLNE